MAILKHIASKNADYGEAQRYLMFQYDAYHNLRKYEKELNTVQKNIAIFLGKDCSRQMEHEKENQTDRIDIGWNIRCVRKEKGIGQTELVRMLQLENVDMTRETLVKIERGI